jgi:hypothetical protein
VGHPQELCDVTAATRRNGSSLTAKASERSKNVVKIGHFVARLGEIGPPVILGNLVQQQPTPRSLRVVGVAHVPRSEYPCTAGHGGRLRRACGRQALSLPTPRPNAADSAGHKSCVAEAMPCRYEATMQTALQKFIIAEFIFFDDM